MATCEQCGAKITDKRMTDYCVGCCARNLATFAMQDIVVYGEGIAVATKSVEDETTHDDIVNRLLRLADADVDETARDGTLEPNDIRRWGALMREAADEIARLRENQ